MKTQGTSLNLRLLLVGLAAGIAFTGCISTDETVYRDEARMNVSFENDTAARYFYEKLSKSNAAQKTESKTEVSIPVVFDHKHRVVQGENFNFNRAVRRCDTNGDGQITEAEARIYSQNKQP